MGGEAGARGGGRVGLRAGRMYALVLRGCHRGRLGRCRHVLTDLLEWACHALSLAAAMCECEHEHAGQAVRRWPPCVHKGGDAAAPVCRACVCRASSKVLACVCKGPSNLYDCRTCVWRDTAARISERELQTTDFWGKEAQLLGANF